MEISVADLLPSFAVVAAAVYALFHLILCVGMFRHNRSEPAPSARISIIVAARNESESIGTLLEALRAQTRVPEEIIIVDDRSEDSTSKVVEQYRSALPQLQLVRINELPGGRAPKKNALESGIRRSTGDILCFTDADCMPPSTWIARIEGAFGTRTGVVAGLYAPVWDASDASPSIASALLRSFIEYERFKASALLVGSTGVGFPWLASGSNLAYRRRVFDDVGGFAAHQRSLSGDDDLFVQRVRRTTDWHVTAVPDPEATVSTTLPHRWSEFFRQRTRHFSAGRFYDPVTSALLGLYHLSNVVATMALIAAFIQPIGLYSLAYVIKLSSDLVLLVAADLRIKRSRAWKWFVPLELLNVAYVVVVGPLGWFSRVRWKEQPAT